MQHYLVFDIETAPTDWDLLSDSQKEYWLRNTNSEEEIEDRMFMRSLTPFTAQILCIGCMIIKRENDSWEVLKKGVLATNPDPNCNDIIEEFLSDNTKMQLSTERKVIEDFWKILNYYNYPTLISFNGRNFDAPFIMLRSAVHKIRPAFNLMAGTKFSYSNHIDLIDELTFFSPTQWGATKKFNFDFYAHGFGIVSPKAQGIDGSKVPEFYAEGRITEIAEYCMRDVKATWELFLYWNEYLNFKRI